ncbi:hypothetical protein FACS189462_3360 [Spirochaetia bacterium]|nr:hypothetical protein FACS189462_3360 [Spirochaetia bacterium]
MNTLIKNRKKVPAILFIASLLILAAFPLYAAELVPTQLSNLAESLLEAFTGDVAKIIIGICFAGSCIAYAFNKDNEKMKGKVVAVVVATGLLALSQVIVDKITSGVGG